MTKPARTGFWQIKPGQLAFQRNPAGLSISSFVETLYRSNPLFSRNCGCKPETSGHFWAAGFTLAHAIWSRLQCNLHKLFHDLQHGISAESKTRSGKISCRLVLPTWFDAQHFFWTKERHNHMTTVTCINASDSDQIWTVSRVQKTIPAHGTFTFQNADAGLVNVSITVGIDSLTAAVTYIGQAWTLENPGAALQFPEPQTNPDSFSIISNF